MKLSVLLFSLMLFAACVTPKEEKETPVQTAISQAHQTQSFFTKEAIQFDLELFFRGKKRLEGTVTSSSSSDFIRIDKTDGSVLVFNGTEVFLHPDTASWKSARFDIFTWQYFALASFKLQDPGTVWTEARKRPLYEGKGKLASAKLSFESGTGDAPDDWYVAYQNSESGLLEALAYIVTYSKDQSEAEKEPHAITFGDYKRIDGIAFAHSWKFWNWSEEGIEDQLGEAQLSNVGFVKLDSKLTAIPSPSRLVFR